MNHLPLGFKVRGRGCLLVGGTQVALRKARLLHEAGARLRVVAPAIDPELRQLVESGGGECFLRAFQEQDCTGAVLVVAADPDPDLNRQVARTAQAAGIPVNAVDDLEASDVIFPAMVRRPPLWFAISSGGGGPMLARFWRARLEALVPEGWGTVARIAQKMREPVRKQLPDTDQRRRFWERVLGGNVLLRLLSGGEQAGEALLREELAQPVASGGEVYLVGAGPGDPELLTLRALQLMQQADIVFYDRLVSAQVLERVRRDAEQVHVGKQSACHPVSQERINDLLIENARAGKRVLRLKGGDPFIFGRGGEEIERLAEAGVPFEVTPGISAAGGCACYAGIPLTHREYASSVRFLAGHPRDGQLSLPWRELVAEAQTLVFYMSSQGLPLICKSLCEHGAPEALPAALIERGTLPEQRVISGTLGDLAERVAELEVRPPTLLIVGEVVRLREQLRWR